MIDLPAFVKMVSPEIEGSSLDFFHLTPADLEALKQVFLPPELQKAISKRQLQFQAGRLCAVRALSLAGVSMPYEIKRSAEGLPLWPEGYLGSISHTDSLALAVVVKDTYFYGLGLDTEMKMSEKTWKTISPALLSSKEEQVLISEQRGDYDLRFLTTILFSAKESFFKCFFPSVKKFFGFHDVELVAFSLNEARCVFRFVKDLNARFPKDLHVKCHFCFDDDIVVTLVTL